MGLSIGTDGIFREDFNSIIVVQSLTTQLLKISAA